MQKTVMDRSELLYRITKVMLLLVIIVKIPELVPDVRSEYPKRTGYYAAPMRIDPVDLDEIIAKGNTSTITIRGEPQINMWESVNWDKYLGQRASISYTYWDDYTNYNFHFQDSLGNIALGNFWTKLEKYLHLSEEELQHEMDLYKAYRQRKWSNGAGGKIYGKKPDFDLILEDLGEVIEVDDSEVGYEIIYYDDTATSKLNTYCLVVETELEDRAMSIQLLIDGDSDIQIRIECDYKVYIFRPLLVETFQHIGLPTSLIQDIEWMESWDYYG